MHLIFRMIGSRRVKISKALSMEDELDGRPAVRMGGSITGVRGPSGIKWEEAECWQCLYSGFPASWSTTPSSPWHSEPLDSGDPVVFPPWSSFAQTFFTTTGNWLAQFQRKMLIACCLPIESSMRLWCWQNIYIYKLYRSGGGEFTWTSLFWYPKCLEN